MSFPFRRYPCWEWLPVKESFLEPNPQGTVLQSDYYQNPTEALNGIVAAYNPLSWTTVSSYCPKMVIFNAASDDTYSGGGGASDNPGIQAHQYLYADGGYAQCSTGPLEP